MGNSLGQAQISLPCKESETDATKDVFACCSRYRQCSDAKTCLIPNLSHSKSCLYRKSLDDGNIFYGKNATSYDFQKYQFFLDAYSQLSYASSLTLCDILHYVFVTKNGTHSAMFLDTPELFDLAHSGFFNLNVYPAKIVNKCKLPAMKSACGDRISDAISWAEAKCKPEDWVKRKGLKIYRNELAEWILKYDSNAVSILCDQIHFVDIAPGSYLELTEFFFDSIYREGYIPTLSPCDNDPRFLAQ